MRLTVKELIARAYEVARVLKNADAALLREVATRLDVTYVALSESMERNQHIAALSAENSALKSFILSECFVGHIDPETFYQEEVTRYVSADGYEPETPATTKFISEQQAIGVERLAEFCRTANNGNEIHPDIEEIVMFAQQLRDEVKPEKLKAVQHDQTA